MCLIMCVIKFLSTCLKFLNMIIYCNIRVKTLFLLFISHYKTFLDQVIRDCLKVNWSKPPYT
jgi:hypothetical protein